jgi:hypothetical protein
LKCCSSNTPEEVFRESVVHKQLTCIYRTKMRRFRPDSPSISREGSNGSEQNKCWQDDRSLQCPGAHCFHMAWASFIGAEEKPHIPWGPCCTARLHLPLAAGRCYQGFRECLLDWSALSMISLNWDLGWEPRNLREVALWQSPTGFVLFPDEKN